MDDARTTLEQLRELVREAGRGHGDRLKRALAIAAIPVTAGLTTACYAAPSPDMLINPYYDCEDYEAEVCSDGLDNDCDGQIDCSDSDCLSLEACLGCDDGQDNDGDGLSDCSDASCAEAEACAGDCANETDDDNDGLSDCADPDCAGAADCA